MAVSRSTSNRPRTTTPKPKVAATRKAVVAPAKGVNPKLAAAVKAINIHKYDAKNGTTYCNMAANAYAKQLGYKGLEGLNANQINAKLKQPGSGFHKATAAEAMAAAKKGDLVLASWTGKAHGHVSMVLGEYAPGVPAIAQAGGSTKNGRTVNNTFEYGPITRTRANPTYFVRD
jgi:poly-gamma-glutamate capsule biosynthesis protein CapA/YwtB (metallophosphatase superfamily)